MFHFSVNILFYNTIQTFDGHTEIFLENAARAYGLAESELFQTIDLFEKRNIPQVTQCLFTLGRQVSNRNFSE